MDSLFKEEYVLKKLARFVEFYAPEAFTDMDLLISELNWFSVHTRLWLVHYQDRLIGLGTGLPLSNTDIITEPDWFDKEDPDGEFFYARLFVIHPLYRQRYHVLESMVDLIASNFPSVRKFFWHNEMNKLVIRRKETLLKGTRPVFPEENDDDKIEDRIAQPSYV